MEDPLAAFRIISSESVTSAYCGDIAVRATAAAEVLERWGARRGLATRLREAIMVLRRVAESDCYGPTPEALLTTVDAIALAGDFFQIAQCLGPEVLPSVGAELAQALARGMSGTPKSRRAVEFQAQYWVGMLLASSSLEPRILGPEVRGTKPDFIVDIGTADVAVEVKRPASANSMIDALDRAAGQLRDYGKPGIVFLDLSDCLYESPTRLKAVAARQSMLPASRARFFELARLAEKRPPAYTRSDKYAHVLGVVPYARVVEWLFEPELIPAGEVWVVPAFMKSAYAGLLVQEYPRLVRLILQGMEVVNGSAPVRAS